MSDTKPVTMVKRMATLVYDGIRSRDYGEVLKYQELGDLAGVDIQGDRKGRTAVLMAGRRLLHDDTKLLSNVPNVGYQILRPAEHVDKSQQFQAAARRRLKRAAEAVVYVDISGLSDAELARLTVEQVRVKIKLAVDKKLSQQKALPAPQDVRIPSGAQLLRAFRAKEA